MSAKAESFDISLEEASRTFKALGADNPCPMCGGDTWHSVLDGDRAHLALPLYTNDGRPLADGTVIPVMFLVCGNCLFIRLHPTRGILQKAAEVEAAEKSALASEIEALREEVAALRHDIERHQKIAAELATENEKLREKAERFQKLDAEAASHVEAVICARTNFTGEPPYVGWQGLGLALRDALDERDRLREENERMKRVIGRESINVGPAGSGGENPQSL